MNLLKSIAHLFVSIIGFSVLFLVGGLATILLQTFKPKAAREMF